MYCGQIPNAAKMKLANNLLLITMLNGLMEAVNFAKNIGLDEKEYFDMIDAGPMANSVYQSKYQKIIDQDDRPQAPLRLVYKDALLICELAEEQGISLPLFTAHCSLLKKGVAGGLGDLDVVTIIKELKNSNLK